MPLGEGFYGTEADGTNSSEYCKFCFQNGAFTKVDMTLEKMIQLSVANMVNDLHMPQETAVERAKSVIPNLKRWNKSNKSIVK
jgi:hypothetical protein